MLFCAWQNELQNIEDGINELELADEDEKVMYREGEIFLYKPVSSAQVNINFLINVRSKLNIDKSWSDAYLDFSPFGDRIIYQ